MNFYNSIKMSPGIPKGMPDEYFFKKMVNNKVIVFIDGTYLYKIQKEFERIYNERYKIEYNQ